MSTGNEIANGDQKKKRERSPNHPMVDLKTAIVLLDKFFGKFGKHTVPIGTAHLLWDYAAHGSAGNQCVAALVAYELLDVKGKGKNRKLSLTDTGERIVREAPDRETLIKSAALKPAIHKEVVKHYENDGGLPPDELLKTYLQWERPEGKRFSDEAVSPFITRLRNTLQFAGVSIGGEDEGEGSDEGGDSEVDTPDNGNGLKTPLKKKVRVGSLVQWTSQGVERFPEPRKVSGVDGEWAFVEGSQTGIPMSELTVVDAPVAEQPPKPPVNPFYTPPQLEEESHKEGMAQDRTTLDEGAVRLDWPDTLSEDSVEEFQDWMIGRINRARRKAGLGKIKVEDSQRPTAPPHP